MKDEPQRQTLRRRADEPKLEVGDLVEIKDGVVGVVLARFKPSGERRNEVHYIVELRPETGKPRSSAEDARPGFSCKEVHEDFPNLKRWKSEPASR
jgi:hypothetical protein